MSRFPADFNSSIVLSQFYAGPVPGILIFFSFFFLKQRNVTHGSKSFKVVTVDSGWNSMTLAYVYANDTQSEPTKKLRHSPCFCGLSVPNTKGQKDNFRVLPIVLSVLVATFF